LDNSTAQPPIDPPKPIAYAVVKPAHAANEQGTSVLLVIAVFKILKAALLISVGLGIHHLLNRDASVILSHWVHAVRIDPDNKYIHAGISKITGLNERTLREISFGTFAYGGLFLIEGTGLLLRKRWAEYLTVVSTTGLLPLEVYELFHHPRLAKFVVLGANLLIVAYLAYRLYRTRSNRPKPQGTSTV
jgi:uncharacterized membrane protein (DUF2068 family)